MFFQVFELRFCGRNQPRTSFCEDVIILFWPDFDADADADTDADGRRRLKVINGQFFEDDSPKCRRNFFDAEERRRYRRRTTVNRRRRRRRHVVKILADLSHLVTSI